MPPFIYHMAEEARWKEAGEEGYFPAKFAEDGCTHATKEPHLVLPVANRFMAGVQGIRSHLQNNQTDFSMFFSATYARTFGRSHPQDEVDSLHTDLD